MDNPRKSWQAVENLQPALCIMHALWYSLLNLNIHRFLIYNQLKGIVTK